MYYFTKIKLINKSQSLPTGISAKSPDENEFGKSSSGLGLRRLVQTFLQVLFREH